MMRAALLIFLLAGCQDPNHKSNFTYDITDMAYPNGHPLALNYAEVPDLERSLIDITNARRASLGLSQLTIAPSLSALARAHSAHMIIHRFYGHDNPEGDGPGERLHAVIPNSLSVGLWENVLLNVTDDMQAAFDKFWNSPSHKAALLSNSDLVGVGIAVDRTGGAYVLYVTMEFAKLY